MKWTIIKLRLHCSCNKYEEKIENSENEPINFFVGTVTNPSNAKDKLTNQNQNISMHSKISKKKFGTVSNPSNAKEKITNQNQNISMGSKFSKTNWGQWVTYQMPKRK